MSLRKLASSSGQLVAWHHVRGSKTWESYRDRDRKGISSGLAWVLSNVCIDSDILRKLGLAHHAVD